MRQDNWNIEQLRQSLDRKIAGTEERIRKGLEEAKKDYSRFFEWQADEVYKAGRLRDYYGVFRNKVNGTDDVEELQRYFKDIVRYQQERLLANPPARNSTSPMANMAGAAGEQHGEHGAYPDVGVHAKADSGLPGFLTHTFPQEAGTGHKRGKQTPRKT